jgi:hypothetical protein
MPEAQIIEVNVHIYYTESSIKFDFYPGNPYFDYGLNKEIVPERWKRIKNGDIWLGGEVTEKEAIYIEKMAYIVFKENGYEVIGRPKIRPEIIEAELAKKPGEAIREKAIEPVEQEGQLSLF